MSAGDEVKDQLSFLGGFKLTFQHLTRPRVTTQYPEEKKPKFPRQHGRHVLNRYEDGMEKCIGCELCAGVCPADCIYVRGLDNPPDHPVSPGERYGFVYEINFLRCIHCDMCVEACPTEAITESKLFEFSFTNRSDAIYTKDELLVGDDGHAQEAPLGGLAGGRRPHDERLDARHVPVRQRRLRGRGAVVGRARLRRARARGRPVGPARRRRHGDQAAARGARAPSARRGHPAGPPRHAGTHLAGQGGRGAQPQEDGGDTGPHEGAAGGAQGDQGRGQGGTADARRQ